jgi:hypothetical protein
LEGGDNKPFTSSGRHTHINKGNVG